MSGHSSCPKCGAGIDSAGKSCGSCGAVRSYRNSSCDGLTDWFRLAPFKRTLVSDEALDPSLQAVPTMNYDE